MLKSALLAGAAALMLGLGGCLSLLPEPMIPEALIALPADRAQAPADALEADVGVFPPDASRAYSGVDIAVADQQELVYLADVRWSDAAPRLLQGAVIDALSKAGGEGQVTSAQQGTRTDYDLRWRVVDLSVSKGVGPVKVVVDASVVDSQTRRVVGQERFSAEGSPTGAEPRARAAALALAAQSVADQVAAFVATVAVAKTDPVAVAPPN